MYRIYKPFFSKNVVCISNCNFACLFMKRQRKISLKVEGSDFANLSEDGTQANRHFEIKPPLTQEAKASQNIILVNF